MGPDPRGPENISGLRVSAEQTAGGRLRHTVVCTRLRNRLTDVTLVTLLQLNLLLATSTKEHVTSLSRIEIYNNMLAVEHSP